MRQRLLGLALGLSLFALVLSRLGGPEPAPSAAAPLQPLPPSVEPLPAASPAAGPSRNLFEYGSGPRPVPRAAISARPTPVSPVSESSPPADAPVRLVGFVRQNGVLKAALAMSGDIVMAGPGEVVQGYAILTLDEDAGVQLRGPDGVVSTLKQ